MGRGRVRFTSGGRHLGPRNLAKGIGIRRGKYVRKCSLCRRTFDLKEYRAHFNYPRFVEIHEPIVRATLQARGIKV